MSYCINPNCRHPENPPTINFCQSCGSKLLIDERYRVTIVLGQGGFGKTFEVRDRDGTRKVLKVLTYIEPKGVELFQKEANVLQRLRHPGLPAVESDGYFTFKPNDTTNSLHCLVMEKVEGKNLQQWLESESYRPIDSHLAIDWLTQLTEILNLVHNQNYFHRDIKPPNIMRRSSGKLVLVDFGAVREVTETIQRATGEVTRISSAGYTPEEQKKGKAEPRSDFFALGRTFVYLLTAQEPKNLQEDVRSGKLIWRTLATQASKPLADLLDDLMAHFPNGRPKDTQILLQRLAKMVEGSPSPSRRNPRFALGWKQVVIGTGVAGAIAASAFAMQNFSKTHSENLLTYQSSAHNFKIKYPEKWEKQELQNPVINDVVVFISPKKTAADSYQEQITISIEDLQQKPMSLDEYNKLSLAQIKNNFTDVKILEENSKTVANNRGYTVVFDDKDGQTNTKKMLTWTLINNKAYVITYTAEKSEYSEYLKTAEAMMNSLEIN
ncbi:serine/threonine-protein kinase [Microcoleus sp. A006_D1]|uniref:serine/threonine-protein kinase n=1 Tax=Microcoleus sp. A006_D1 TaxID=3055267 RepID=UPI002FD47972